MLVYQTMGSLQKLTLGIDVAKNHAIMLCCQAVMAPAGPVGGEAAPVCGKQVFSPLGASHCVEKRSSRTLGRFGGV